jgi:ferredoxin--NADP+ reductase
VAQVLKLLTEERSIDRVFAMGCTFMMMLCSEATREYKVPTMVSLNSIMVDGTGMCGACRIEVGGETKFVCVDGPEFDGHLVNFELLVKRRSIYLGEESKSVERI